MAKKELAEAKNKELVNADLMGMMAGDVGAGMEHADKDSFAIPFLNIIQKMSPQVDEADAAYIEGAKPGMLFNTVTQKLYDGKEGITFLPCAYQRKFIKWGPRGTPDAGFKGEFLPEQAAAMREEGLVVEKEGRLYFPLQDGTVDDKKCDRLEDTRNHFGIMIDANGDAQQVLMSLGSTQIKKSKQMMSMLNSVKVDTANGKVTPPTWMNKLVLTTIAESNDKGSWHGLKVGRNDEDKFVQDVDLYNMGKEFHGLVSAGEANVNYDAVATTEQNADKF